MGSGAKPRRRKRSGVDSGAWIAAGGRYNSGLPVELEGATDEEFVEAQYGRRILDRVNFERGRVRPSSTVDLSAGLDLWRQERRNAAVVVDVLNLTDRLNVINFSGVFSGTSIEPGRSVNIRLQVDF